MTEVIAIILTILLVILSWIAGYTINNKKLLKNETELNEALNTIKECKAVEIKQNKYMNEARAIVYDKTITHYEAILKLKKLFIKRFQEIDK